jgi:mono/diheme cytochrome c family protein
MHHRRLCFAVVAVASALGACDTSDGVYPYGPGGSSGYDGEYPPDEGPSTTEPDPDFAPPKGPQPQFGATVTQTDPPPPISGGTLVVSKDGSTVVAADSDRDRVYVVTLADKKVTSIALAQHDEPGRVVLDDSGRAHVVLRRGGAVATIDLAAGKLLGRRAVCAAPRGIDWDAGTSRLLVACEGGEVLSLAGDPTIAPTAFAKLDRDLRDVVVVGTRLFVSRFRAAEVLELGADGAVLSRTHLAGDALRQGAAVLAWRMIAPPKNDPVGEPIVVHQSATQSVVQPAPGGYGSASSTPDGCFGGGIVSSVVTHGHGAPQLLPDHAVLPVDVVYDGSTFAVVAAGNGHTPDLPQLFFVQEGAAGSFGCSSAHADVHGQITSVAPLTTTPTATFIVFSRQPAQLEIVAAPTDFFPSGPGGGDLAGADLSGTIIPLATESREDTGHAIFHANSGSGIACASCHGEGGDDGRVWSFDGTGSRRTPSLRGTIEGTAPYHWGGEEADISHLVDDVLAGRMNGPVLDDELKNVLQRWVFALPPPNEPAADPAAAARGKMLFESTDVGCSKCHTGPKLTNSLPYDVGTGGAFQVPSLVGAGARLPLMHNGCAKTLADRFGACATPKHGTTGGLSQAQIADMVAYLSTL